MKIQIFSGLYQPFIGGGAEIIAAKLAEGLLSKGHDVQVFSTRPPTHPERETVNGVVVERARLKNIYWHLDKQASYGPLMRAAWHALDMYNLAAYSDVKKAVAKFNPDVVVSHNLPGFSASLWSAVNDVKRPLVQMLHDYYAMCPRSTRFKGEARCERQCSSCALYRLPHKRLSRKVTGVIGASAAVLDRHLQEGFFQNVPHLTVIHNSRVLSSASFGSRDQEDIVFGFIGALCAEKGPDVAIKAFQQAGVENARLLIAGDGSPEYTAYLKSLVNTDRVQLLGRVDPSTFYPQIDCLILPSQWEDPFPGVTFEALSYGVPVFGARIGGIPEMVMDGVNGALFEHKDVKKLQSLLSRAKTERGWLKELKKAARPSASKFVDEERMLNEHIAFYGVVAGGHAPAQDVKRREMGEARQ